MHQVAKIWSEVQPAGAGDGGTHVEGSGRQSGQTWDPVRAVAVGPWRGMGAAMSWGAGGRAGIAGAGGGMHGRDNGWPVTKHRSCRDFVFKRRFQSIEWLFDTGFLQNILKLSVTS